MEQVRKRMVSLAVCLCLVLGLLPAAALAADASPSYLALGDSITTGYAPTGKVSNPFTGQVAAALGYTLNDQAAADGETTATLWSKLQDSSNTALAAAVADADLITITIGGNDLMNALYAYLAAEYNQADFDAADAQDMLVNADPAFLAFAAGELSGFVQSTQAAAALGAFAENLTAIVTAIRGANPDGTLLVATQYNPYSYLAQSAAGNQLAQTISTAFDTGVKALNTVITSTAEKTGAFTVVDVYAAFEEAAAAGTNPCNPSASSLDFHPNQAGHDLIAAAIQAVLPGEEEPCIYVGDVALTGSTDEPAYAMTDENGTVTLGGSEASYNIKWDGTTLTLKDAYVVGCHPYIDATNDPNNAAIYREGTFEIVLVGENVVNSLQKDDESDTGISSTGDLTITGSGSVKAVGGYDGIAVNDGTLTILSGEVIAEGSSGGFAVYNGRLIISGGEAKAVAAGSKEYDGVAYGIYVDGDCTISGGQVTATGNGEPTYIVNACGIYVYKNLTIQGGTVTAAGSYAGVYSYDGDVIVAPQEGSQIAVTAGEDEAGAVALDGSPFLRQTSIKDAIAEKSYFHSQEDSQEVIGFEDVTQDDWFYDAVLYVCEKGLMDGVGDHRFAPASSTTRAQLVTILYRLEGEPAVTGGNTFTDVAAGQWYTDAVAWAAAEGVVNGVTDTTFAPNNPITREQLATILYRYAEGKGYDVTASADLSGYTDAGAIQAYAATAFSWANAEGLITGVTDTELNPAGSAVRAQIATILMRFCEGVAA